MIETRRFGYVVIFIQTIFCFVLSRKIINIYSNIWRKYGNVTVKDFRKYESWIFLYQSHMYYKSHMYTHNLSLKDYHQLIPCDLYLLHKCFRRYFSLQYQNMFICCKIDNFFIWKTVLLYVYLFPKSDALRYSNELVAQRPKQCQVRSEKFDLFMFIQSYKDNTRQHPTAK